MIEGPCTWLDKHPEAVGQRPMPAHMESCARCRDRVGRLESLLYRRLALRPEPVPTQLRTRIVEAVAARHGRRPRLLRWPALLPIATLAAAVVFSGRQGPYTGFAESRARWGAWSDDDGIAEVATAQSYDGGIPEPATTRNEEAQLETLKPQQLETMERVNPYEPAGLPTLVNPRARPQPSGSSRAGLPRANSGRSSPF
jgi:hypothetical protein